MGIFDKVNSDSSRDEVEISMPDDSSSSRSFSSSSSGPSSGTLRDEVETRLTDDDIDTGSESSSDSRVASSRSVSLEDIHEQNAKIIRLLETLTEDPEAEDDNNTGMAGGLDGVL
ncbi:MAG: hypothetical protein ABEJ99_05390 [Candidatus Nanohaloarchaea archaeon]